IDDARYDGQEPQPVQLVESCQHLAVGSRQFTGPVTRHMKERRRATRGRRSREAGNEGENGRTSSVQTLRGRLCGLAVDGGAVTRGPRDAKPWGGCPRKRFIVAPCGRAPAVDGASRGTACLAPRGRRATADARTRQTPPCANRARPGRATKSIPRTAQERRRRHIGVATCGDRGGGTGAATDAQRRHGSLYGSRCRTADGWQGAFRR